MTVFDTLGLGFMTFALFLGASNFIFPPFIGLLSGDHLYEAMFGFLVTAVGLPLVALIAVAKANGKLVDLLPKMLGLLLIGSIYVILGPAIATPRTASVSYEIGFKPFIETPSAMWQFIYTSIFLGAAALFSAFPGRLLDSIGKVLTPVMIFFLMILAGSLFFYDGQLGQIAIKPYQDNAFIAGFLEGYNTMDALGAIMFGMLIIETLKAKGLKTEAELSKYLIAAGFIAATGLVLVYASLFVLGGLSANDMPQAQTGSEILTYYVLAMFGNSGLYILAAVVTLACLTTAVGLMSASAQFFHDNLPQLSYPVWVMVMFSLCLVVANIELHQLILLSKPVLLMVYPVAIVVIVLTFMRDQFNEPVHAYKVCLSFAFAYGLIDAGHALAFELDFLNALNEQGLGWVMPSMIALGAMRFLQSDSKHRS